MEKDPSEGWYKGELGFFDFYIIPLAKKLKDCGVFGVSSDEYLSYAMQNRKEWETRGEGLVSEMLQTVKRKRVASTMYKMTREREDKKGQEFISQMTMSLQARSSKDDLFDLLDESSTASNSNSGGNHGSGFAEEEEYVMTLK